jgi:hypothetical protein
VFSRRTKIIGPLEKPGENGEFGENGEYNIKMEL